MEENVQTAAPPLLYVQTAQKMLCLLQQEQFKTKGMLALTKGRMVP